MLIMTPGSVYCVKVMSHVMLLIVTANGSCVRVKAAQVNGTPCPKPGTVTRALDLTTHRERGVARVVDDRTFQLEFEA